MVVTESFNSLYLLPCSFPSMEGFLAEGCIDGQPPHGCHLASANENPRKRDGGEDMVGPHPCKLISVSWLWSRSPLYPDLSSTSLQWLPPLGDHSSLSLLFPVLSPLFVPRCFKLNLLRIIPISCARIPKEKDTIMNGVDENVGWREKREGAEKSRLEESDPRRSCRHGRTWVLFFMD